MAVPAAPLALAPAAAALALALVVAASADAPPSRAAAAAATHRCRPAPGGGHVRQIRRPRWVKRTVVTEYFPTREDWFRGRLVRAPGIPGRHRVDWLYSSGGLPMEGQGIGRDGRVYHFAGPYSVGWVSPAGRSTIPCPDGSWTRGWPAWLAFGWRNARGAVTFPLPAARWSNGRPARYLAPPAGLRFAPGRSLPLRYWRSAAVDPKLIPLGSRIFIAAYCDTPARGWFVAQDTGGAIIHRHVDVYRPPPSSDDETRMLRGQAVFVVPPRTKPRTTPRCPSS